MLILPSENRGFKSYLRPHAEAPVGSNPETLPSAAKEESISSFFCLGLPATFSLYYWPAAKTHISHSIFKPNKNWRTMANFDGDLVWNTQYLQFLVEGNNT